MAVVSIEHSSNKVLFVQSGSSVILLSAGRYSYYNDVIMRISRGIELSVLPSSK